MSSSQRYYLMDPWLIDGSGVHARRAGVLVDGGRIEAVMPEGSPCPPGAVAVPLQEAHLLPGLINAHSHLLLERSPRHLWIPETPVATIATALFNAEHALARGVTTVRDAGGPEGWDLQLRDLIGTGFAPGPRMLVAGRPITRTGGHFHFFGREADGPVEVRKAVREQMKAGVDVIKIMATGGYCTPASDGTRATFTEEELHAAVDEAHTAGLRIMAHAVGTEGIRRALVAGVDSVEHGCILDERTIDLFGETGAYLVPTLSTIARMARHGREWGRPQHFLQGSAQYLPLGVESLSMAVAAGIPMAVGTDVWGEMVLEMELLVSAGMAPARALAAATSRGAEVLGREDLGRIEVGRRADLLVVADDPLDRLDALRSPAALFQDGRLTFSSGRIPISGKEAPHDDAGAVRPEPAGRVGAKAGQS